MNIKDKEAYKKLCEELRELFYKKEAKNDFPTDKEKLRELRNTDYEDNFSIGNMSDFIAQKAKEETKEKSDEKGTKTKEKEKLNLTVWAFNVGQGDMSAILLPNGKIYLIDCYLTYNSRILKKDDYLQYSEIFDGKEIECLIITHKHFDHCNGLRRLQETYNITVKNLLYNMKYDHRCSAFIPLLAVCCNSNIYSVESPAEFYEGDVKFKILNPTEKTVNKEVSADINNSSIILAMTYGKTRFLFTGDADAEVILAALDQFDDFPAESEKGYLKISHHGSRTGTIKDLKERLSFAENQYISHGDNKKYNHPHQEVTELYKDALRSKKDGSVQFISNGEEITVRRIGN